MHGGIGNTYKHPLVGMTASLAGIQDTQDGISLLLACRAGCLRRGTLFSQHAGQAVCAEEHPLFSACRADCLGRVFLSQHVGQAVCASGCTLFSACRAGSLRIGVYSSLSMPGRLSAQSSVYSFLSMPAGCLRRAVYSILHDAGQAVCAEQCSLLSCMPGRLSAQSSVSSPCSFCHF